MKRGRFADSLALTGFGGGREFILGTQPDPVTLSQRPGGPDFVEYAGAVDVSVYREQMKPYKNIQFQCFTIPVV